MKKTKRKKVPKMGRPPDGHARDKALNIVPHTAALNHFRRMAAENRLSLTAFFNSQFTPLA